MIKDDPIIAVFLLDTLKIYVQPQAAKPNHLVINFAEEPQLYLADPSKTLAAYNIRT